jgi:hypothetical protein
MTGAATVASLSTTMFVLAFCVTTILHEFAHGFASLALGDRPVVYTTYVRHGPMTPRARALTSAAGPLASLTQGVIALIALPAVEGAPATVRLLTLWLGLHGLVNFFGYLITAPYAPAADVGKIIRILGGGQRTALFACAVGLAANIAIGVLSARWLLDLAPDQRRLSSSSERSHHLLVIAVVPWIVGALVITAVRRPAPHRVSVLYPFFSGLFTLAALGAGADITDVTASRDAWEGLVWWPWLGAIAALAILFRTVLARGVPLGRPSISDL